MTMPDRSPKSASDGPGRGMRPQLARESLIAELGRIVGRSHVLTAERDTRRFTRGGYQIETARRTELALRPPAGASGCWAAPMFLRTSSHLLPLMRERNQPPEVDLTGRSVARL